jgi:hypothetical protein
MTDYTVGRVRYRAAWLLYTAAYRMIGSQANKAARGCDTRQATHHDNARASEPGCTQGPAV